MYVLNYHQRKQGKTATLTRLAAEAGAEAKANEQAEKIKRYNRIS